MGLATSVALPLLYYLFIQAWANWHYARRGLPFDGMGAAYGVLTTLELGAALCVISFLVYAVTLAKERRFSVSRAIETGLFIIVMATFLSVVYQFLQVRQNFVALL